MNKNNTNTQLNKALKALLGLAVNVTAEDRKAASKEYSIHEITISRYFTGEGTNLDTAVKLLTFFRARIADREKTIAA